jgi:membrane-bound lytic murein transglycosylase B
VKHSTLKTVAVAAITLSGLAACAGPLDRSPRPETRSSIVPTSSAPTASAADQARFQAWVADFRPRALAQGISPQVFDRAFRSASYQPDVIRRDRNQSEFNRTIWDYLDTAVSDTRISNGRAALSQRGAELTAIEARYGVEKEVVAAVWGMESSYGTSRGSTPIIPALATLAEDGRRASFFEQQLVAALKILQSGDVSPEGMTGSWAGAMGHTQFIPTSYLAFAVDFRGDGKRDIWSDDPTDALASTAAYLSKSGWVKGQPWAVEVVLPAGFNYNMAGKGTTKSAADWAALGVRAAAGGTASMAGPVSILLPAGSTGVALMIGTNFRAISRYNAADSYVIGVGHLSDRLRGKGPFVQSWPRTGRALTSDERQEIQRRLTRAGYDTQGTDGMIGPNTINAITAWQRANGMTADGYATLELLQALR